MRELNTTKKKRWVSLYVENRIGVLARISGMMSGKSYKLLFRIYFSIFIKNRSLFPVALKKFFKVILISFLLSASRQIIIVKSSCHC